MIDDDNIWVMSIGLIVIIVCFIRTLNEPKKTVWCADRRLGVDVCYISKQQARELAPNNRLYSKQVPAR